MGLGELILTGVGKLLALAMPFLFAYLAGRNSARADAAETQAKTEATYAQILADARPGAAADRLRRGDF